jgi:TonB family protein
MSDLAVFLREFWVGMFTHLWQVSVVLVPLFVLSRWVRRAPARVSDAVWTAGFAKLFLPLALLGGASRVVIDRIPRTSTAVESESASAVMSFVTTVLAVPDAGASASATQGWWVWGAAVGTIVWVCGVFFFLARLVSQVRRAGGMARLAEPASSPGDLEKLRRVLDASDIPPDRVLVCGAPVMPAVVGFIRPKIVISRRLIEDLSVEELRAILLHEDTHRRRFDPLQSLIRNLGAAIFFFYPPVWRMLRTLDETAEFVCDERAVHAGTPRRCYTLALARTIEMGMIPVPAPSITGGRGKSLLLKRLERLNRPGRSTMAKRHYVVIVLVAALVAAGSFWPAPINSVGQAAAGEKAQKKAGENEVKEYLVVEKVGVTDAQSIDITDAKLAPRLIKYDRPKYPEMAKVGLLEGTAVLKMRINREGRVDSMTVKVDADESARKGFEEAILATRDTWLFEPAKDENGEPVSTWVKTLIKFRMNTDCDGSVPPPPPKKGESSSTREVVPPPPPKNKDKNDS